MGAKHLGPKRLADLIDPCVEATLRRKGFVSTDLIANWAEIVGPRFARRTQALEIRWPRPRASAAPDAPQEAATLVVRVEGALALEFDYARASVIERINAHFGWRCISRLALSQGPVEVPADMRPIPAPPAMALDTATVARLDAMVPPGDDALTGALRRLGAAVLKKVPAADDGGAKDL